MFERAPNISYSVSNESISQTFTIICPHPFYHSSPVQVSLFRAVYFTQAVQPQDLDILFYPMHATYLILLDFISLMSPYLTCVPVSVVIRLLSR